MRKGRIITAIALWVAALMLMSCGYQNGPPGDTETWPEDLDGEFASEYGTMSFIGDGDSIVVDFSEEFAEALECQTGKRRGTYVFLFDNKSWRYDKSDEMDITIDGSTFCFANDFTRTNGDRIVLTLADFNDNEPIVFERVK